MPTDVILPQLGESVAEGVITRWLKHPGDHVNVDEPLVEISTDKVNVELPAPAAGIIQELRAQEGETVPVEQVIAVIGAEAGAGAVASPPAPGQAAQTAQAAEPGPTPGTTIADEIPGRDASLATPEHITPEGARQVTAAVAFGGTPPAGAEPSAVGERRHFSPLVRRIARENGLDLESLVSSGRLTGTGEGGRVSKSDILEFLSRGGAPMSARPATEARQPAAVPPTPPTIAPTIMPAPPAPPRPTAQAPAPQPAPTGEDIVVPFTGIRKMIADHLVQSAFTAPHVTTVAQADVTKLVAFRGANKESWEKEYGVKLTYTPFFIKATADALLAYPMVNAQIQGDKIVAKRAAHIGVAVSLGEGGLIVPVIRDAQAKDLITLAKELDVLARKARESKLAPGDVQGGTFSITNPGVFGAIISTPIINAPQSAILGVEAIQKVPVVREDDSIAIRSMMYLCLSYDHRVIDGETAIRFLQHIRQTLENFRFFR